MEFTLALYTADGFNRDCIGVVGGMVETSVGFPQAWLDAAKRYLPGDEALSVLAWMLAAHDGEVRVEGRRPVWHWGRKEEARAYVEERLGVRGDRAETPEGRI